MGQQSLKEHATLLNLAKELPMTPRSGPWIAAALASVASPGVAAQFGGYGQTYAQQPFAPPYDEGPYSARDPRQGRIEVATFLANSPNIGQLGHGPVVIAPPADPGRGGLGEAAFETALVDQLARAGYQTGGQGSLGGQIVEFVVYRDVLQPPEPPHSPVSGGVAVGAGNRGSGLGIALAIDLSKPLGPLVSTRIEARIRDSGSKELLWQGRAEVLFREGDKHWKEEEVAAKLTAALFKGFPRPRSN